MEAAMKTSHKHNHKPEAWKDVIALASNPSAGKEAKAYGAFLDSIIGRKPWLSCLAMAVVNAAAALFIEDGTAYSVEKGIYNFLSLMYSPW